MDNETLVFDLVEWAATQSRTYDDVTNAWRSTCSRLTIWEGTVDAGYDRRVPTRTDTR